MKLETDSFQSKDQFISITYSVKAYDRGLDNLRASKPCKAYVRGTQLSLKNTLVSLHSTQVSLSSSPVSLMVSMYVGGCSCLASLACLACMARTFGSHASHVWLAWLAWLARLARWLSGSHIGHTHVIAVFQLYSVFYLQS